jgi:hypothetical protein
MKEGNMSTTNGHNQRKGNSGHLEFENFEEEGKMERATETTKVNMRLIERLAKTPVKLLGGLALGALLATAAALPFGSTYADEPARPLTSERIQCYPEDNVVCLHDPFGPSSTGNLLVTDENEVWPEIDSGTPIHHLVNQLKAGSPPSINGIRCYPEDNC